MLVFLRCVASSSKPSTHSGALAPPQHSGAARVGLAEQQADVRLQLPRGGERQHGVVQGRDDLDERPDALSGQPGSANCPRSLKLLL